MNAVTPITPAALVESPPLVIQEGPAALMAAIMQFASNPNMDLDKFDRLIALQERAEDRQIAKRERADAHEAELAFNAAFVRLTGKLPRIKRDGSLEYPVDKNRPDGPKRTVAKYARWEDIDGGIRPVLTEEGFALSFKITTRAEGGLNVSTVLRHIAGYKEIGDPFPSPLDTSGGKNNAQAYGSALSYGKKYAAFATLNIITEGEDTDGRAPVEAKPAEAERVNGLLTKKEIDELAGLLKRFPKIDVDAFLDWQELADIGALGKIAAKDFAIIKNELLTRLRVLTEREAFQAKARATAARAPNRDGYTRGIRNTPDAWEDIQRGDRP
jgi:hypothetical protein